MSAIAPAPSYPKAINDRVQDLFLLAKGQYRDASQLERAEAARRIVGFHNLYDISRMSLRDASWVVCSDLLPIIQSRLVDHRLVEFLASLGPHPITGHGNHKDGYFAGLIEAVLEQVALTQVVRDDTWLMPFPRCVADPSIAELLSATSPENLQASG